MQQNNKGFHPSVESELSDVWKELLQPAAPEELAIPTLASDPWSTLLQAKGIEMVDLHTLHLEMSDQDVEQALQVMQEQATQRPE